MVWFFLLGQKHDKLSESTGGRTSWNVVKMGPSCSQIWSSLESYCRPLGLETAPLKVGWYNEALQDKRFAFNDLDPDTLAFIVVSSPSMFEKAFIPFVRSGTGNSLNSLFKICGLCYAHTLSKQGVTDTSPISWRLQRFSYICIKHTTQN